MLTQVIGISLHWFWSIAVDERDLKMLSATSAL